MKKIEVKVRYLFEETYTVAADDRNEARTMVTRDCGLVLGETSTRHSMMTRWIGSSMFTLICRFYPTRSWRRNKSRSV